MRQAEFTIGVLSGPRPVTDRGKYRHTHVIPSVADLPALYDLTRDPEKRVNFAADPAYATVLAEYAQRMLTWRHGGNLLKEEHS